MNKEEKLGMIFNSLANTVSITQTMLDKAETAYTALGNHIKSSNENWDVSIYPQGSFELGTVIKPLNEDEQYDVDLVVLVKEPEFSSEELRSNIKLLLENHGRYDGKIEDKKPCIRIQYADSSRFHMDVACAKNCLDKDELSIEIARFNGESEYYYDPSNPKGYIDWFKKVMQYEEILIEKRAIFNKAETKVEKLNLSKIRSPLQKAIQILKRHRDIYFSDKINIDDKPSSIIITTLCGLSYDNSIPYKDKKENIYITIRNMLNKFNDFIDYDVVEGWIMRNPSMNEENFLKKWNDNASLVEAFTEWIGQAREDILINPERFIESDPEELRAGIYKSFGERVGEEALFKYGDELGELAKSGGLRFNLETTSISTDDKDRSYKKHTYFGSGMNE